jgi:hypothetical protein
MLSEAKRERVYTLSYALLVVEEAPPGTVGSSWADYRNRKLVWLKPGSRVMAPIAKTSGLVKIQCNGQLYSAFIEDLISRSEKPY